VRRLAIIGAGALAVAGLAVVSQPKFDPFGLYASPAHEVEAPLELTGRVVEAADLLTPEQEASLVTQLENLERDTLAQLVVVTTRDLEGMAINAYSLALGRGWRIGDAERNDGLLLVIAPNEREVRIEVGYGLEQLVSDPLAAQIIEDDILPRFREGDFPGGIFAGTDALEDVLRGKREYREAA